MFRTRQAGITALRIGCLFLSLFIASSSAYGKRVFAVEGQIQDESGISVWGAQVELKETTKKISVATTSADNGSFRFAKMPGGEYQIIVKRSGFVPSFSLISVPLSSHARLRLSLVKEKTQAHVGPEVTITEPFDMVPVQDTVKISAKANDPRGIARIEIYIDGELEASAYSDSIAVLWDSTDAQNGKHTVFAKAYNGAGEMGQSEPTILPVGNR